MPRKFDFVSPGVQITEIDQSKIEAPLQDDGLLVIGRSPSGPALKPIKVNSLENFIDVFGKPVSGKGTINDDVWRDGNNQGPTYAMYAAQAWLASNTSPVTFVRLLGEDSPTQDSGYVKAGWDLGGADLEVVPSANGTAYGLFMVPSGAAGTNLQGTLAAVLYTTGSGLTLSGTIAGTANTTSSAGALIESISTAGKPGTFKLEVHNGAATYAPAESLVFHFDPDEKRSYIRNVLNTNPQRSDSTQFAAGQGKDYFVGETYEEAVSRLVTSVKTTAGEQYGLLLPLQSGSLSANNMMYHKAEAATSKTGWVINRDPAPTDSVASYSADLQSKLFRLVALSEGEWFEKNYYITIEDMQLGSVKNPNSSFSVKIRNLANNVVEQFSNLNLDESSEDFIGKKIGDMFQTWDNNKERYEMYGEYPNQSNYVRVEMADDWKAGIDDAYKIPFGFFGPVQPKGFTLISGSAGSILPLGSTDSGSAAAAHLYVKGAAAGIPFFSGDATHAIHEVASLALTASLTFPRLKLTEQNTAKAGVNYIAKDIFGLNHKFASKNERGVLIDRSYIDLLRYQGGGIDLHAASDATQYSFVFSLDDVRRESAGSSKYYWASGSHASGDALTATEGTQALLTSSVKQFALPMFGGFDGVDVSQIDPFSNKNILDTKSDTTHYANYSIKKAIDAVSDSEVVAYDVISIPGLTNATLSNQLISAVEDRGDALAIIDLDDEYKETYESGDGTRTGGSINDVQTTARTRDLNTSYAATYYPRVRMRDTLSGNGDIFIAPASVAGVGALAFSDANSEGPWFAPAGFNRGGISILGGNDGPRVTGTWKNLPKSDRDELYELNINPIARFPAVGEIVIFGQKTLQQTPSALDRINVRRLMVYLKKRVGAIADTILFDQNVQATWSRFKSSADLILADVQARFGITEYKLVLDETTTTPDLVDQNIMYAKIFVKPARAIEFIAIDFVITRSGVQF
jgi:hypothetical protein